MAVRRAKRPGAVIVAKRIKVAPPRIVARDTRAVKPVAKVGDPFYSSRDWLALMARLTRQRGRRCQDPRCRAPDCANRPIYGDHVVELRDGGAPLDECNVLLRCPPCHGAKTAAARARRAAE